MIKIIKDAIIATIKGLNSETKKKVENGNKFRYVVNGFSGNWTNIQIQVQEEGEKWIHKTIKK